MVNVSDFDLNLLVVFDALLRERNVTRAGSRIGMSQPSMSNALTRLRKAWGDPLFVRTPNGMEPTPLALRLAKPVQLGLATLREGLEQPFGFEAATSQRRFRLLMSDVAQVVVLPLLMKHLKVVAPLVKISALALPREDYANALETDRADLVVGNLPLLHGAFYQQRLFEDDYVCLIRNGHPLLKGKLELEDYLEAQHLTVINSVGDAMVSRELALRGLVRNTTLEVPNFLTVSNIVKNSDLLATAPSLVVRVQSPDDAICVRELAFSIPRANVRQFWHLRYHNDPAHQWLRAQLARLHHGMNEATGTDMNSVEEPSLLTPSSLLADSG